MTMIAVLKTRYETKWLFKNSFTLENATLNFKTQKDVTRNRLIPLQMGKITTFYC